MSLLDRARAAAAARAALPPEPPTATELQETAARDLGRKLEIEIDPLTISEHGLREGTRYDEVSTEIEGILFRASYLWGGRDQRYHYAGNWEAARRPSRLRRKPDWRPIWGLADVGEIAGFALDGREMDGNEEGAAAA